MADAPKRPQLVGNFVRQRREAVGLSQRALGMLFSPPVTTQFISNVERGVTPLPPNHVPTLSRSLQIPEAELLAVLEREYTVKLSGRLGRDGAPGNPTAPALLVAASDFEFMRALYEAYRDADPKSRQAFASVCGSLLNMASTSGTNHGKNE